MVRELLEYGADRNAVDCDGKTPLGLAVEAGYEENVLALEPPTLVERFGRYLRGSGSTRSAE